MRFLCLCFFAGPVRVFCAIALFASCLAAQATGGQGEADIILHNGKILTVDDQFSIAEAVAIQGNKVSAVGSSQDVLKLAGSTTQVIDLKGRTVIPGLIDTHLHIHGAAARAYGTEAEAEKLKRYSVDWRGVRSTDDVVAQLKGLMDKYQFAPGEWIYFVNNIGNLGFGGSVDRAKLVLDDLTRWELDKAVPDNPAMFTMGIPIGGGIMVNSKALEILMDRYGWFLRKYGKLWTDDSGRPDGHLEAPASMLVQKFFPTPLAEDVAPLYKKHLAELVATGITTISTKLFPYSADAYKILESRGELSIRLAYGMRDYYFGSVLNLDYGLDGIGLLTGTGTDRMWVNGVGASAIDGAGTRACTNLQRKVPFGALNDWWPVGQCHMDNEYRGGGGRAAPMTGNYFREFVLQSGRKGVRFVNTHAAGDRTVKNMLDLVEQLQQEMGPEATKGWALDHCTLVNPADFKRIARLGLMMSCAPKYIETIAPAVAVSYGEEVAHTYVVPVKSMLDAGVKVVFEMDRDEYTWHDLEILLTRKDKKGNVWGPQEIVDRATALRMITRWAAEYVMKKDELGWIKVGKPADLAVLNRDYMTIPVEEVNELHSLMTVLDGDITYLHPEFQNEHNLRLGKDTVVGTYDELYARRTSERRIPQVEVEAENF